MILHPHSRRKNFAQRYGGLEANDIAPGRPIVIAFESVYSMDGDIALSEYS